MRDHNLYSRDVARIIHKDAVTVRRWMAGINPTPFSDVAYLDLYLRENRGTQLS